MKRPPAIRATFDPAELVVDNFAGGGGASVGIEAAIGRPVDIAVNHDAEAIAMHQANHPKTKHYLDDIWQVDPRDACNGRPVGLAWFSPDCKHFSRAKGTALRDQGIRGLAWVVIRWAKLVRPRVIVLENVEEFQTWGPLVDGRPCPDRSGSTFRSWIDKLRSYGYEVEFRSLVAADYGAPTTRRRLFLVARRDGGAARWPQATHGKDQETPWRPASEIIDWSLPCPSIFERKRPLKEATLRRIAVGIQRYVLENAEPFIVPMTRQNRPVSVDEPLQTVTTQYNRFNLVAPFIVRHGHYSTRTGAGLREGCGAGTFRGQRLVDPLATVCATNDKHLVAPLITKHYGGVVGHGVERTLGTVTAKDHHALTAAFLVAHLGADAATRVQVGGEFFQIVDIGMRMLQPHELFAAQGFPKAYELAPEHNGKALTKTAQVRLAGNSVCPPIARAIVQANVTEVEEEAAA